MLHPPHSAVSTSADSEPEDEFPCTRIMPFPTNDPLGHVYHAQIEIG